MKFITLLACAFVTLALAGSALAREDANAKESAGGYTGNGKKVHLSGEAMCAKCVLHQGDTCQTVIQTKHDGNTVTYYVAQNATAKALHEGVCKAAHKVKVTGFVDEVEGKHQLTLTKLALKEK